MLQHEEKTSTTAVSCLLQELASGRENEIADALQGQHHWVSYNIVTLHGGTKGRERRGVREELVTVCWPWVTVLSLALR